MDTCIEITLAGTRCKQRRAKEPLTTEGLWCYYHDKVQSGLTGTADTITIVEDDEL